jgi:signal transduction histidine kinase
MIFLVIVISIALITCISLILLMKRDIRNIIENLKVIKNNNTNIRLTTLTFDRDISNLILLINEVLDKEKQSFVENKRTNKVLKETITNVSHDLRTPLTSIIGYIQMIQSPKTSEDRKKEYYSIIENRLNYLSQLINSFFEYTQTVEGKDNITMAKVNICNLLRDILSLYYEDFIEKNFNVKISIPEQPIYFIGDSNILKRVIQNLIQNVLIHGIEEFQLVVDDENNSLIFKNKVENLQEIDVDRLFDRFYTGDISRNKKTTGLGLSIAKELIINSGGSIKAYKDDELLCISLKFKKVLD